LVDEAMQQEEAKKEKNTGESLDYQQA